MTPDLEGQFAYKVKGFYGGIIGRFHFNADVESYPCKFIIEYKDGAKSGFNNISEVEFLKPDEGIPIEL